MHAPTPRTWVFLRGLGREAGHWGEFPAVFGRALGVTVRTADLPGFGALLDQESPSSIAEIARALEPQLRDLERPFGVLANSLGGMVALELARALGPQISHVVLINSSVAGLSPPWRRLRPYAMFTLLRNLLDGELSARETRVIALTSNRPEHAAATHEAWSRVSRARPPRKSNVVLQLRAAARYRLAPLVGGPRILVLTSHRDRMVHWSCSKRLASFLGAALEVHASGGHDLALDEPAWVIERTNFFLKS